MQVRSENRIGSFAPSEWNRLVPGDQPFLRHEFLHALEETGCTGPRTGWYPHHLGIVDDHARLRCAVPLYIKDNSFGEFTFDWAWAAAYERMGRPYYPKIVAGVPFTPVSGPRLLIAADDPEAGTLRNRLVASVLETLTEIGGSSAHWLLPDASDWPTLTRHDHLFRKGVQFHWHNAGYADFDDFLGALTSKRRKEIRRERRRVAEQGIRITLHTGEELDPAEWDRVCAFYRSTFERKGNFAALTPAFFDMLRTCMGRRIRVVFAREGARPVAMSFNLAGERTLYGRYWGALAAYDQLHFETCYYTPVEHAIREGLEKFEAGAQGEHKVSRGFVPVVTYTAHHIRDAEFRAAIADFIQRETALVDSYMADVNRHSPYRTEQGS